MNLFTEYFLDPINIQASQSAAASIFYYRSPVMFFINLIDAGHKSTADQVVAYINDVYGVDVIINNLIVTHYDKDHTGGVTAVLDAFEVKRLWLLRPWQYTEMLLNNFSHYPSSRRLADRLKEDFSHIADIEEAAQRHGVEILAPLHGTKIERNIHVLSPSLDFYLKNITLSDETPRPSATFNRSQQILEQARSFKSSVKRPASWGEENFPQDGTSPENEMSVVQFITCYPHTYLLTGDAGIQGMEEAVKALYQMHQRMPKINFFEAPHHGSRYNLNSDLMDALFGKKISSLEQYLRLQKPRFYTIIQATTDDDKHPSAVVERSAYHRGGAVFTPDFNLCYGKVLGNVFGSVPKGRLYPREHEA